MLITMSQCQRRHAANTNYWYCWTSADRLVPIQSIVDRMWFRISTKICSNSSNSVQWTLLHCNFSTSAKMSWCQTVFGVLCS